METKCLTRLECLVTALHHSKRILPAEVEFCVKEALEAINYSDSTFAQLIAAKLSIIATLFPTIVCQNLNGILNYTRHAQVLIDMLPSILSLVSREIMSETIKSLLEVAKIDSELILPVLNILSVVPIVRPLVHNVTDFINSAIISTDEQNFPCVCRLLLSSDLLKPESLETLLIEVTCHLTVINESYSLIPRWSIFLSLRLHLLLISCGNYCLAQQNCVRIFWR